MVEPPHHGAPSRPKGTVVTILSNRQTEILNIARTQGRVMVEDLARRFEVSAQTIRKDLNDLCDHRSLTRIHGGAIIASGVENLAYEARRFVAAEEKKAIGAAAAAQIPNGCSLFINIGTTTEEVARALLNHRDLRIITNNLNVASIMSQNENFEVIIAGGVVRSRDQGIVGETTIDFLDQFKVDFGVIGISGIDADGSLLDFDHREVRASKCIIANSRQVFLVADHSKFGRNAMVRLGTMLDLDAFYTDRTPPRDIQKLMEKNDIHLFVAESLSNEDPQPSD